MKVAPINRVPLIATVAKRMTDAYGTAFPFAFHNAVKWPTYVDQMREYAGKHYLKVDQNFGFWQRAVSDVSVRGDEGLAKVIARFEFLHDEMIAAHNSRVNRDSYIPTQDDRAYGVKLVGLMNEYVAGKQTRGEYLATIEIYAKNVHAWDRDIQALYEDHTKVAANLDGGLLGTFSRTITEADLMVNKIAAKREWANR